MSKTQIRRVITFLPVLAFLLLLSSHGRAIAGTPTELKFASISAPDHVLNVKVHTPWIEQVQKATNNQVKITLFPGGILGGAKQAYDLAAQGIADISYGWVHYHPGRFPLSEVYTLPGVVPNVRTAYHNWEVYHKYLTKEWADTKLLWLGFNAGMAVMTRDKQIRTLEDFKGLKLAIQGSSAAKIARALGAVPVDVNTQDVYTAVQRKVVDGTFNSFSSSAANKFGEVMKYYTTNAALYTSPCFAVMNLDRYNNLPPDIRKVIDESTGQRQWDLVSRVYWDAEEEGVQSLTRQSAGKAVFYNLPLDMTRQIRTLMKPIWDEWTNAMQSKGLPGKQVLDSVAGFIEE